MAAENSPFEDRTLYTLIDAVGDKTTIRIDKLTADVLQAVLLDVHAWIQERFNHVVMKRPRASRREQGNLVRALANAEAQKHPQYQALLSDLL